MTKLSDTQSAVLSAAAAREDGLAALPSKLNKAAAAKVGTSLVTRKLMREVRAKPGQPVWRVDVDGRGICLAITRQGRKAIGSESATRPVPAEKPAAPAASNEENAGGEPASQASAAKAAYREGSKIAALVAMLSSPGGVTLDAIVDATGWLPHTTRAALTGLRKRGFAIERTKQAGQASTYRIDTQAAPSVTTEALATPTATSAGPRTNAKEVAAQAAA